MDLFEAIEKRFSNRKYLDKQISDEDLNGLSVSIGIKKGNTELADEINAALSKC